MRATALDGPSFSFAFCTRVRATSPGHSSVVVEFPNSPQSSPRGGRLDLPGFGRAGRRTAFFLLVEVPKIQRSSQGRRRSHPWHQGSRLFSVSPAPDGTLISTRLLDSPRATSGGLGLTLSSSLGLLYHAAASRLRAFPFSFPPTSTGCAATFPLTAVYSVDFCFPRPLLFL